MAEPDDRPSYSFDPGPPPEASRFLRNKGWLPAFSWQDVEPEEHAVAFTVAKATSMDVLRNIREEVQAALEEGLPFREFQRRLQPRLEARGWWGRGRVLDPAIAPTDTSPAALKPATLGTPRRLRTIYDANLRSARSAGQWERIERTKRALPYLVYRLGPSERHRPHHETKEGMTLPVDDPWWDYWMVPNGWGCKCWVQQITRRQAEALGIDEAPAIEMREWTNSRTGEIKKVPIGIDPGWERNPGKLRRQNISRMFADRIAALPERDRRVVLRDIATSWRVARILRSDAPGDAPVGFLDEASAAALGSDARLVRISQDTATKQRERHPDVQPDDYARAADNIATGRAMLDGVNLVFVGRDADLPWISVVKRTVDGSELYLTTHYRVASARYLRRLLQRGQMIRE